MDRIGIIAGSGKLPIVFAKEAKKKGVKIIGFAIKGMASPEFDSACDKVHKLNITEIKKFFLLLLMERIRRVVLLGKVDKKVIFNEIKDHEEAVKTMEGSSDQNDYTILDRATEELKKRGVEVIDGLEYISSLLPSKGVLTGEPLSRREHEEMVFGLKIAKELARFDIGQTIVVKDKTVVSVEAMEGTDETIERAAKICKDGFTVIKVSRPHQDMRWDVPTIGPKTLELIAEHKGRVLAIEEKKTFLVEKEKCIEIAKKNNISIVIV